MNTVGEQNPITPFAVTDYRDVKKRFGIKDSDRQGHIYILGKTGTGKSTLIQNMAASDIRRGQGLALIDPHGDLAQAVLNLIPRSRIDDVVYFNPSDIEYPIAFNPLEKVEPDKRHLVVSGLISVFKKLWADQWFGPRMEHVLRHCILALLEQPQSTLLDIPRLLTDKYFRAKIVANITNQIVRDFWMLEFEKYSAWLKSEASAPVLNRVGQFLAAPLIRNIIGQPRSAFNLRQIMDERKILIIDLSKGRIGEDNCSLLGSLLVTKLQLAALSRADMPEENRRQFNLFIDEFQCFTTLSFLDALSEARKYKLYLVMAHQYLGQLDERIRSAVIGNVGTVISFRVGAEDAKSLAREFFPVFNETDLVNLPNYRIYLKLMIDGCASRGFSAVTLPPPRTFFSYRNEILALSRSKYGTTRKGVEWQIMSNQMLSETKKKASRPSAKRTLF